MFPEDVSIFMDGVYGFALSAELDGTPVTGIFDRPSTTADGVGGYGAAATLPTFQMPDGPVSQASQGKTLLIDGVAWRVADVRPDGTGLTTLHLERP